MSDNIELYWVVNIFQFFGGHLTVADELYLLDEVLQWIWEVDYAWFVRFLRGLKLVIVLTSLHTDLYPCNLLTLLALQLDFKEWPHLYVLLGAQSTQIDKEHPQLTFDSHHILQVLIIDRLPIACLLFAFFRLFDLDWHQVNLNQVLVQVLWRYIEEGGEAELLLRNLLD